MLAWPVHRTRFWDAQLTRFCNRYTILQQTYNSSKLSKDIKMCWEGGQNPKTKWHFSILGQVRKDNKLIPVIIRLAISLSFEEFELRSHIESLEKQLTAWSPITSLSDAKVRKDSVMHICHWSLAQNESKFFVSQSQMVRPHHPFNFVVNRIHKSAIRKKIVQNNAKALFLDVFRQ